MLRNVVGVVWELFGWNFLIFLFLVIKSCGIKFVYNPKMMVLCVFAIISRYCFFAVPNVYVQCEFFFSKTLTFCRGCLLRVLSISSSWLKVYGEGTGWSRKCKYRYNRIFKEKKAIVLKSIFNPRKVSCLLLNYCLKTTTLIEDKTTKWI